MKTMKIQEIIKEKKNSLAKWKILRSWKVQVRLKLTQIILISFNTPHRISFVTQRKIKHLHCHFKRVCARLILKVPSLCMCFPCLSAKALPFAISDAIQRKHYAPKATFLQHISTSLDTPNPNSRQLRKQWKEVIPSSFPAAHPCSTIEGGQITCVLKTDYHV